jgi:hypothetical protein
MDKETKEWTGKREQKKNRKKRKGRKGKKRKKKKGQFRHFTTSIQQVKLLNVFENGFSSIRKAAPPKEPEPEPFLKESEPCQT